MQSLEVFAAEIGHNYKDINKLEQALTHRSISQVNNERLEFLGDSIVNFVIAEALYTKFPDAREGALTRLRAELVKKESLSEVATCLKVQDHLRMSPSELNTGGMHKASIKADALEAIIGSIHLDSGFTAAKNCILVWFKEKLADITLAVVKDPKTRLQEHLQKFKKPLPSYEVVSVEGEAHAQTFHVACHVAVLNEPTRGVADSRQKAEFIAARQALELLK